MNSQEIDTPALSNYESFVNKYHDELVNGMKQTDAAARYKDMFGGKISGAELTKALISVYGDKIKQNNNAGRFIRWIYDKKSVEEDSSEQQSEEANLNDEDKIYREFSNYIISANIWRNKVRLERQQDMAEETVAWMKDLSQLFKEIIMNPGMTTALKNVESHDIVKKFINSHSNKQEKAVVQEFITSYSFAPKRFVKVLQETIDAKIASDSELRLYFENAREAQQKRETERVQKNQL